jgi:glycerophosphoryl diester phosphodiesterase
MTNIKGAEIIGHRGSSHLAPENTLASLNLGWQETTTCEVDIHATLDGRLLLIHDATTQRTTGINLNVREHTLDELQQLDAGSWKGPQWQGEKLPSLDEAIAAMPEGKRLLIEMKTGLGVIPELSRVIQASGKEEQLLLQSFFSPACVEFRKAFPNIPVYLLIAATQEPTTRAWWPPIDEAVSKTKAAGLDGININDTALLDDAAVQKVHAAGLKIYVWTIDQIRDAKRLLDLEVDGLITNRPGRLKAQLASS